MNKKMLLSLAFLSIIVILAYYLPSRFLKAPSIEEPKTIPNAEDARDIYLAGGCFWGVEAYMEKLDGVYDVVSGYANGNTENPSYEDVIYRDSGHAETVKVSYDSSVISLDELLLHFFQIVDPTSINKQGNDVGSQYRSGIYYEEDQDKAVIDAAIEWLAPQYDKPIAIEISPLDHFYLAEDYHQDYLTKNPYGYCHIDLSLADEELEIPSDYKQLLPE